MKKIAVLFAFASLTAVGCVDNNRELCLKTQACIDGGDAAECDANDDGEDGDNNGDGSCDAEADLLAACLVANGTCDEIEGVEGKFYGVEAVAEGGACETQAADQAACLGGND